MEPNFWLVGSSVLFFIPMCTAVVYNDPLVALFAGMITATSMSYHATKPQYPILLSLDILLANVGFLHTSYTAYMRWPRSTLSYLSYITYGLTLYHVGHTYSLFMWDKDPWVATRWHMSMHLLFSLYSAYSFMMMKQELASQA